VAASRTIEGEDDGCVRHLPAVRVSPVDERRPAVWPGARRPGLSPKAEADASAGPRRA